MMHIIDFHTHQLDATDALISVSPQQFDPQPDRWYSVGYHPWQPLNKLTEKDFDLLAQCAAHPQVLAIGETGMDRLCENDLDIQAAVFVRHLRLASTVGKPVVVHSVRTTQDILTERRKAGLTDVVLAIHGMRANANVARTLIDAGCYVSIGPRFNPDSLLVTPLDRLLIETDDAPVSIDEVAACVASVLHLTPEEIKKTAAGNAQRLLIR